MLRYIERVVAGVGVRSGGASHVHWSGRKVELAAARHPQQSPQRSVGARNQWRCQPYEPLMEKVSVAPDSDSPLLGYTGEIRPQEPPSVLCSQSFPHKTRGLLFGTPADLDPRVPVRRFPDKA
ncbi:hypothetical protein E2C01_015119 [Portunus trituberculatus]|uniref:Uncharacterized protein n=1 Tax=Portunus trituberculatus TaxID=210409 RepID=A0A5B7DKH3_PORTR|nr:hypothetical protein [Portunus trituberculatus]